MPAFTKNGAPHVPSEALKDAGVRRLARLEGGEQLLGSPSVGLLKGDRLQVTCRHPAEDHSAHNRRLLNTDQEVLNDPFG